MAAGVVPSRAADEQVSRSVGRHGMRSGVNADILIVVDGGPRSRSTGILAKDPVSPVGAAGRSRYVEVASGGRITSTVENEVPPTPLRMVQSQWPELS